MNSLPYTASSCHSFRRAGGSWDELTLTRELIRSVDHVPKFFPQRLVGEPALLAEIQFGPIPGETRSLNARDAL
jgi:hypothetical protein